MTFAQRVLQLTGYGKSNADELRKPFLTLGVGLCSCTSFCQTSKSKLTAGVLG